MKKFALLVSLLLLGLLVTPLSAQPIAFALFLGQDSGHTALYYASLDGKLSPLSPADAGDVLVYDADANAAAFVTRVANKALTLYSLDLNTRAIALAPLASTQVSQIVLTDKTINLVTRSADDKPTVLTFDRATLQPIAQHSTHSGTSVLTIQASGKWVMAYNASGALDVLSLPDASNVDFDLVDFAHSQPVWSPAKGQLQFIGSTAAKPNDRFIYLVDFESAAATSQRFPIPADSQASQWSDHGHFILSFSQHDQSTFLITSVSDGMQKTLSEPGFILTPIGWSFDDSWLLYTAQIGVSGPIDLFAYNTASGTSSPVHDLNNTPLTARWAGDSNQLLVIAQGTNQTLGLFSVAAPAFDTWQPLVPSVDAQIVQSSAQWKGSTLLLEYAGTVLKMDTGTHSVLRLSPKSISVAPGSVRLIG